MKEKLLQSRELYNDSLLQNRAHSGENIDEHFPNVRKMIFEELLSQLKFN